MRPEAERFEETRCDGLDQTFGANPARFIEHHAAAGIEREMFKDGELGQLEIGVVIQGTVLPFRVERLHQDDPPGVGDGQRTQDQRVVEAEQRRRRTHGDRDRANHGGSECRRSCDLAEGVPKIGE
jgi:hypothetical protein